MRTRDVVVYVVSIAAFQIFVMDTGPPVQSQSITVPCAPLAKMALVTTKPLSHASTEAPDDWNEQLAAPV